MVAKHTSRCGARQNRWARRTSACYFYVVAHKNQSYVWDRTCSGFLPENAYPVMSNLIVGVKPPSKLARLRNVDGKAWRKQVTCYFVLSLGRDLVDLYMS